MRKPRNPAAVAILKQDGFYIVTAPQAPAVMALEKALNTQAFSAVWVADGKMFGIKIMDELDAANLPPGLIFHGPFTPLTP